MDTSLTTNPETQTANTIPEVTQALSMTDSYVDSGANKISQLATIIGGDTAKGIVTTENLKKVMMFIGAMTTLGYLTKHAKEKWTYALGGVVAIVAIRKYFESQSENKQA